MNDYHGKMQKISPFDWDENVKFYMQILPYLYIFESLFSYFYSSITSDRLVIQNHQR